MGCLLGQACGDALGVPHEFKHWSDIPDELEPSGGGPFGYPPGSYSDDTEMSIPILRIAARADDLIEHIPEIIGSWRDWLAGGPRDVGVQTRSVLGCLSSTDEDMTRKVSKNHFEKTGRAAGNGALMRTAPVALAYLDDPHRMAEAARRIAQLTHYEDDAWISCVIWCAAIRHAVLTGELDFRIGLELIPEDSRQLWEIRIAEALEGEPRDFPNNGWTVHALQASIASINGSQTATEAIVKAVKAGGDTDTIAAISGALSGAIHGVASLPMRWRNSLNGWPEMNSRRLTNMAIQAVDKSSVRNFDKWPNSDRESSFVESSFVAHPIDPGVFLGNLNTLNDMELVEKIEVVIALCRVGNRQTSLPTEEFWLVDAEVENLHLDFILRDVSERIQHHRELGKKVLVICYAGQSRTPAVAGAHSILNFGITPDEAVQQIYSTSSLFRIQPFLYEALRELPTRKVQNN